MRRLEIIFHDNASKNNIKLKEEYAEKFSKTTGIKIQSQHWGRNIQLSLEVTDVKYFSNSVDPGIN